VERSHDDPEVIVVEVDGYRGRKDAAPRPRGVRVPLGVQALLGLCGLLLLAVVSSGVALALVARMSDDQSRVDNQAVPFASWVSVAALEAKGVANDQRGFLLTSDSSFVDEADQRIATARSAFDAAATAAIDADQADAVSTAAAGFERWIVAMRAEFASYRAGDRAGAIAASMGTDRAIRKTYEQALARAQALGDRTVAQARHAASQASVSSMTILIGLLVAAVAIGLSIVIWLTRTIALPLIRLVSLMTAELG
jgi:methyl-accepting chemotaxis protein